MRTISMRSTLRAVAVCGMFSLASAGLVACGDDDEGTATPEGATTSQEQLVKVAVGISSPDFQNAEIMVADELGYFENHGLDVTVQPLNGSSQIAAAFQSGSIQMGVGDGTASASAMLTGLDEVFFGTGLKVIPMQMWARGDASSVADLRGKKFGGTPPGSLTEIATTAVLKEFGMTLDDVNLVTLSDPSAKFAALQSGAIDAALSNPPGGDMSAGAGAKMIYDASKLPNLSNGYVTTKKFAEANPEALVGFLKATRDAIVTIRNEPDKVHPIVEKYTKRTDAGMNDIAYKFFAPLFSLDPAIDPDLLRNSFQNAADAKKLDLSKYNPADFYDSSAVDALAEEDYAGKAESQVKK